MMDVVFALLAKGTFFNVIEGVNSKNFLLAPLPCSRSPPSFHKDSVIDLWLKICKISRTIRETTSFYPQLSYLYLLYCYMKRCWPPLLDLARQPLCVPFGKLQDFNYLHPLNNHFLNLSLVVTLKYSIPITVPRSDETYNEIRQDKRDICQRNVRELSRKSLVRFCRRPDFLLTFDTMFTACTPQTCSSSFQELLLLCFSNTMLV